MLCLLQCRPGAKQLCNLHKLRWSAGVFDIIYACYSMSTSLYAIIYYLIASFFLTKVVVLGSSTIKISWSESVANNEHLAECTFELQMSKSKNSLFDNVYRYWKN